MPNWAAAFSALLGSREEMAAISLHSPICMAGITFFTAMAATPNTPHLTFFPLMIMPSVLGRDSYCLAVVAYGLAARYRFLNASFVQIVHRFVARSMQSMQSRWSIAALRSGDRALVAP